MRAAAGSALAAAVLMALTGWAEPVAAKMDPAVLFGESRSAIGRRVGDHTFLDTRRATVRLGDFRGQPLVVNLVFSGCSDSCPLVIEALERAVEMADSALGGGKFHVVTIGFDTLSDTPERMRALARAHGIDRRNWTFLSGDAATVERLTAELGFSFAAAPQGFDHLTQTSVLDEEGRVYRQIYGSDFKPQALVEPLKDLIFGERSAASGLDRLVDRIKFICTVYDPNTGRYRFSYAIFSGVAITSSVFLAVAAYLGRAWWQSRRPPGAAG